MTSTDVTTNVATNLATTNRRQFLQTAAALTAAPLASRSAFATQRQPHHSSPEVLIVDARYPQARAFGLSASARIAALRDINGDITQLWQSELQKAWSRHQLPVAGLTERPALFLLEHLGWQHGMRVVFEAEHTPRDEALFSHRVLRSGDQHLEQDLNTAGVHWTDVLAEALLDGARTRSTNLMPSGAAMYEHRGEAEKLYSWIIAPRTAS